MFFLQKFIMPIFQEGYSSDICCLEEEVSRSRYFNPLRTSPKYTQTGGLWEMCVIAKSNCLQRVKREMQQ